MLESFIVESDPKSIIDAQNGSHVGLDYIYAILFEIRSLTVNFRCLLFSWCPQKANMDAHALATICKGNLLHEQASMVNPPDALVYVLLVDLAF